MSAADGPRFGDVARAGALVRLPPARTFALFTEDIDRWWRRGPAWRMSARSVVLIEPRVGGRLYEQVEEPGGPRVYATGEVLAFEPPDRLLLRWRAVNFQPEEQTEVEVRFEARPSGTWVSVEHRGWAGLPADHPVRHGAPVEIFVARMGRWWGDLLRALSEQAG
jgi:uncharacterized protein YndB with AHSA1/START domain